MGQRAEQAVAAGDQCEGEAQQELRDRAIGRGKPQDITERAGPGVLPAADGVRLACRRYPA